MKILFLGELSPGQTALMRMRALQRLGHEVRGVNTISPWMKANWLNRQLQRALNRGSILNEINREVMQVARDFKPEIIWAEKQEYLSRQTIEEMQQLGALCIHFTPDPYFFLNWKRTPIMDDAITAFDVLVYCKSYEQSDYEALGKPLIYMPLGFCDQVHRPIFRREERWNCDVGFLGGWEPRREKLVHAIAEAGVNVKIWGGAWEFLRDGRWTPRRHLILRRLSGSDRFNFHRDDLIAEAYQGNEIYGDDYSRSLASAKIGLGFLRKVCPDQHTTRSFEIPACGSLLIADRTDEHRALFKEGEEAEFFSSQDELINKIDFYLKNENVREKIATAGLKRCYDSHYAYIHRLSNVFNQLKSL